ncbi:MAG: hypothetical protein LBP88_00035 [Treponema sp.]|nr:hypothetical protein [Treponema sp.]
MPSSDYIPAADGAFFPWTGDLIADGPRHFTVWNIPDSQTALTPLLTAFETAFESCRNPNKGIDIKWAKPKEAPRDTGELVNSAFDTKPLLELTFEEHERGKGVFVRTVEIQREGEKGPWGDIEEVIVP